VRDYDELIRQPSICNLLGTSDTGKINFTIAEAFIPKNMVRHIMNCFKNGPGSSGTAIMRNLHVDT